MLTPSCLIIIEDIEKIGQAYDMKRWRKQRPEAL